MMHYKDGHECPDLAACFEREVMPLRAELLRAAARLTNGGAGTEDLLQDALLRAFRSYGTFSPGTNARAWMHQILRNTWINNYRASQRRVAEVSMEAVAEHTGDDTGAQGTLSAEQTFLAAQPDNAVRAALAVLNEDFRKVVYLTDIEGYPYAEVAAMMNTPVGTVMSRLHRARRQLRLLLGDAARRRRLIDTRQQVDVIDDLRAAG
ncbi:ECF RNA polymerase sigma factor SigH [Mycolicibacterium vanbaalenii]|uniref:ECF RNA polymerase sigma factor SigH n=2 Tax=Mycolicibacterium vanbaalenii TaxID=110539 RepID=A0A5S9RB17_MYCVN|nr:ECF RNA polymerase sigma factor SigH [Mycolicibacterium vanbaalenii]